MDNQKVNSFNHKLYAPMILGSILNPINSSIISVSLIPIGTALSAPPSQTAWLVSGLYLATAIGQPVVGKLIDTIGPKILYQICTALVGIASLIAFLAPNIWWFGRSACVDRIRYMCRISFVHVSDSQGIGTDRSKKARQEFLQCSLSPIKRLPS